MPVMSMYKHNRNIPVTTWLNIKVLKLKLPSPCQWWRYIHVQTQQEYRSHYMVKHDGVEVKAALTRSVRAMYRNMPAATAKIQVCTTSSVATARLM